MKQQLERVGLCRKEIEMGKPKKNSYNNICLYAGGKKEENLESLTTVSINKNIIGMRIWSERTEVVSSVQTRIGGKKHKQKQQHVLYFYNL